jgi:hypothetical protein
MNILLGDLDSKVGTENIFTLTIGNEIFHEISIDNWFRVANFATTKNLVVKRICSHIAIFIKLTWIFHEVKT